MLTKNKFLAMLVQLLLYAAPLLHAHPPTSFDATVNRLKDEKPHLFQSTQKPSEKSSRSFFTYKNACRAIDCSALLIALYHIKTAHHLIYLPDQQNAANRANALRELLWIVGTSTTESLQAWGNHALFAKTATLIAVEMALYRTAARIGLFCGNIVLKSVKKIMSLFSTKTT